MKQFRFDFTKNYEAYERSENVKLLTANSELERKVKELKEQIKQHNKLSRIKTKK